jgi:hypothetical protein
MFVYFLFSAYCNGIPLCVNVQNREGGVLQIWNMELRLLNDSEGCNSVVKFDLIKQDDQQQFWKMLRECGLNWNCKPGRCYVLVYIPNIVNYNSAINKAMSISVFRTPRS